MLRADGGQIPPSRSPGGLGHCHSTGRGLRALGLHIQAAFFTQSFTRSMENLSSVFPIEMNFLPSGKKITPHFLAREKTLDTLARTRQACTAGHSRDGVDHVQAHLHAAVGVVSLGLSEAGHTVVAVSQDLDATAVVLLRARGQRAC